MTTRDSLAAVKRAAVVCQLVPARRARRLSTTELVDELMQKLGCSERTAYRYVRDYRQETTS